MLTSITKILKDLDTSIHDWLDYRFLTKHGCSSWEAYHRMYDPDYNMRANTVKSYYHGYSRIYMFNDNMMPVYPDDFREILDWLKYSCADKFRADMLRIIPEPDLYDNEIHINELAGGDFLFVAFKDEKDYLLFILRWA